MTVTLMNVDKTVVHEAIQAALSDGSLLGDLSEELSVGMRFRRELESRLITLELAAGGQSARSRRPSSGREPKWNEDKRDRLIGDAVIASFGRLRSTDRRVAGTALSSRLYFAINRRGLILAEIPNRYYSSVHRGVHSSETTTDFEASVIAAFSGVLSNFISASQLTLSCVARRSYMNRSYLHRLVSSSGGSMAGFEILFRLRNTFESTAAEIMVSVERQMVALLEESTSRRSPKAYPMVVSVTSEQPNDASETSTSRSLLSTAHATILRAARLRVGGISQERFALECKLDRTYMSDLERARAHPSIATVMVLSRRLGLRAATYVALVEELTQTMINEQNATRLLEVRLQTCGDLLGSNRYRRRADRSSG